MSRQERLAAAKAKAANRKKRKTAEAKDDEVKGGHVLNRSLQRISDIRDRDALLKRLEASIADNEVEVKESLGVEFEKEEVELSSCRTLEGRDKTLEVLCFAFELRGYSSQINIHSKT